MLKTYIGWKFFLICICILIIQSCTCIQYSRNIISCKRRPDITKENIADYISEYAPKKVGSISKFIGWLTTGFKKIGIYGWYDYNLNAIVKGEVIQSACSTDRLMTIDLKIDTLMVTNEVVEKGSGKYLRAELCTKCKGACKPNLPLKGTKIKLIGKMVWDGDGHIEIHPEFIKKQEQYE